MDVHNHRVYALLACHSDSYIYALGLLDWLIGPGLRQGNVYDNPLPKMNEWKDWSDPQQIRFTLALIHASRSWYRNRRTCVDKIYPREILCKCDPDLYDASKMNTHEFNKLLGFEAGAHSQFHTPTCSATWDVIQFRARTAILAAESRTQTMWACPINVCSRLSSVNFVANKKCFLSCAFCHILSFILEHTIVWVARKLQHELRMHIPIVVCCAGKVAAPVAGPARRRWPGGSMGNILRIQTMILLIYILYQSLQWSVQYHVIWDYVITPL